MFKGNRGIALVVGLLLLALIGGSYLFLQRRTELPTAGSEPTTAKAAAPVEERQESKAMAQAPTPSPTQPVPSPTPTPEIVAIVNGEAMTRRHLDQELQVVEALTAFSVGKVTELDSEDRRQFEAQTLNGMINDLLVLQRAREAEVAVSDQEVAETVPAYLVGRSEEEVDDILAELGLTRRQLNEWVRKQVVIQRYMTQVYEGFPEDGRDEAMNEWLNELQGTAQVEVRLPGMSGQAAEVGEPAPHFTLKDLEGEAVSLSDFRGQVVVVNFWASWCGPCVAELPLLERAYEKHQDAGLVVLAVNLQEEAKRVRSFIDQLGVNLPILLDRKGEVAAQKYRLRGLPTSVFVDRGGVVQHVRIGPVNEAFLEEQLGQMGLSTNQ